MPPCHSSAKQISPTDHCGVQRKVIHWPTLRYRSQVHSWRFSLPVKDRQLRSRRQKRMIGTLKSRRRTPRQKVASRHRYSDAAGIRSSTSRHARSLLAGQPARILCRDADRSQTLKRKTQRSVHIPTFVFHLFNTMCLSFVKRTGCLNAHRLLLEQIDGWTQTYLSKKTCWSRREALLRRGA